MTAPRLEAFRMQEEPPLLVPCTQERAWMDAFPDRHAYRCLPLSIANTHGWELLVPAAFQVTWNGGPLAADLTVRELEPFPAGCPFHDFAVSNFAGGIVTFHTGYLFRTPPGWNLLTTGAFNEPRAGISPLTGIVETDWLPYAFTMNWQMLHPGTVRFEKDEVFCTLLPIPKNYLEEWDVAIHAKGDDPILLVEHEQFHVARELFRQKRLAGDPEANAQVWQRHYFTGRFPDGTKNADHLNRLRLNQPIDRSGTRPMLAREEAASDKIAERLKSVKIQGWRRSSVLESMDQTQTEENRRGEERLRDGVLIASPTTVTIAADAEPEAFDFIRQPRFLSEAECNLLIEAVANQQEDVTAFHDVLTARPGAGALIWDIQRRVRERLRDFYQLLRPVFPEGVYLERRRTGMHAPVQAESDAPFPDFASLIFLDDAYDGGELYFPRLDLIVKPAAGMLLAFTGGWHHAHGELTVLSREQLAMRSFHTFDESRRDRDLDRIGPPPP